MFEYVKWITIGVISYVLLSAVGVAEEKKPTVIDDKIKSAQMWAIGFGADIKQQQIRNLKTTTQALKQDWSWSEGGRFTWRLKNQWEDIKQYQRQSWKQATEQRDKTSAQLKSYWQMIADGVAAVK